MRSIIRHPLTASRISSFLCCVLAGTAHAAAPPDATNANPGKGQFLRTYWYERGIEHGNPSFNSRFRVNAPEVVVNPSFMYRSEPRGNGMMLILIEEDLAHLAGAELYTEIWGGHPGTANKRVTINGRSTYAFPEVGTAAGNCTHMYPLTTLKRTDLVNGYNAIQFACDQGKSFWGHFIVDNACLRIILKDDHPHLEKFGLAGVRATVEASGSVSGSETIDLRLDCPRSAMAAISSVEYIAHYEGYDENGNAQTADWHGFTKKRQPVGRIGVSREPPFAIEWDTSMLPDQGTMAARAIIHFKDLPNIVYRTGPSDDVTLPRRKGRRVVMCTSQDQPKPFWSRASRVKKCTIAIDTDPEQIERAQLRIVIWDGGRGKVTSPFTLNGHPLPVAGTGRHDVLYRVLDIPIEYLKRGINEIQLLSDTEHHGIEVLLPGPAIIVRQRTDGD